MVNSQKWTINEKSRPSVCPTWTAPADLQQREPACARNCRHDGSALPPIVHQHSPNQTAPIMSPFPPPKNMQNLTDLTSAPPTGKKAVLFFWAAWDDNSSPGGVIDKIFTTLSNQPDLASSNKVNFYRVEAEAAPELCQKYGADVIPCFVLLDDKGSVVERISGDDASDIAPRLTTSVQALLTSSSKFLSSYDKHVAERAAMADGIGVAPKPLDVDQVQSLIEELKAASQSSAETDRLVELLAYRVPPGVDEAAKIKAEFLSDIAKGKETSPFFSRSRSIKLLGTMQGGYNVGTLVDLLSDADSNLAKLAAEQLKHTIMVFGAFDDVLRLSREGIKPAKSVIKSWAAAEWFLRKDAVPERMTVTVFKVSGETNTDDLSPAPDAWSRPDIPLHALAMLKSSRSVGIEPINFGVIGPVRQIEKLKAKRHSLAYVGDVVGTGSSRKSATNSVLWHMGEDIPYVPNIRAGGICIGGVVAPIFFNTMEDSGALPIEMDVTKLKMGDVVDIYPHQGEVRKHDTDELLSTFHLKTPVLLDECRAGGRIPLIIGRSLTSKARAALGQESSLSDIFTLPKEPTEKPAGYTLAQKIVGRACGKEGVVPGEYCEPTMVTVGSQDTTGPMTRDELKSLACLHFSADLVMQSFCHTAAYPKPVDLITHKTLPDFIRTRAGVSLAPGDGVIHSWLNRMLLPDTVGTGGDSHTRFPIGISFPAGSGLVAFAAAVGTMPLDVPESVLVRFSGQMQPGITLRDLVHAIPYQARKMGLLTIGKENKKNIFSGRILEIEGLHDLTCEQAFELTDASAERSAAACTIKLDKEAVTEYLKSNIVMLKWMIAEGYGDNETLGRRVSRMEEWLANPVLLKADPEAEYAAVIDINLNEIKEPILAVPNDPDHSALLSDIAGKHVDEVFIGSCMTNIGHFRAAGNLLKENKDPLQVRLWMAPPTKMDEAQLREEGYYEIYRAAGVRTEIPGCSLCMGNQARVATGSTVMSTSTRNFPNRLGTSAKVFLGSAELAACTAILGRLPTVEQYHTFMAKIDSKSKETYRYLNFDKISTYLEKSSGVHISDKIKADAHQLQCSGCALAQ